MDSEFFLQPRMTKARKITVARDVPPFCRFAHIIEFEPNGLRQVERNFGERIHIVPGSPSENKQNDHDCDSSLRLGPLQFLAHQSTRAPTFAAILNDRNALSTIKNLRSKRIQENITVPQDRSTSDSAGTWPPVWTLLMMR